MLPQSCGCFCHALLHQTKARTSCRSLFLTRLIQFYSFILDQIFARNFSRLPTEIDIAMVRMVEAAQKSLEPMDFGEVPRIKIWRQSKSFYLPWGMRSFCLPLGLDNQLLLLEILIGRLYCDVHDWLWNNLYSN